MLSTQLVGRLVLVSVCALYAYYTCWLLITPFIEEGQHILKLFPPRYYAIAGPVLAGVLLFSVTLCMLGAFLLSSELGKLNKQRREGRPKAE